ncbi:MAG: hypothetical protein ACI857_001423 [Arenicella sp.]|jgi:hypothetical protein
MNEQTITQKEIPTSIIHASSSRRKGALLTFLLWALLICNLLFEEVMGLNAAIITAVSIPLFGFLDTERLSRRLWWWSVLFWSISAFAVVMIASPISYFTYFVAFLFFTAVNHSKFISLPLGLIQSILSLAIGFAKSIERIIAYFNDKEARKGSKSVIKFITYSLPIIIGIIFLKLYQSADETFYEYTKFINLDWISWQFLMYYILTTFVTYGFYYYSQQKDLLDFEENLPNEIPSTYSDKIERYLGTVNETKIAMSILITLNIMLILYNFIDLRYILVDLHDPNRTMIFSEMVHNGINSLIASLILVIIIISFLFRGAVNFSSNKTLKVLGIFWLIQNSIMVITTLIKNWEYVEGWGLTHKRIGVFIYLFLALVGLSLALYKIAKKKSFWFLLRNSALAFALVLTSLTTFSWSRLIADYNLSHLVHEKIDFHYLHEMGPSTYKSIANYHTPESPVPQGVLVGIAESIEYELDWLVVNRENLSWRSLSYLDYQLDKELRSINITVPEGLEQNYGRNEY